MQTDPISVLKNGFRIVAASGLTALSRLHNATEAAGARALVRAGLPTRADLDRLAHAVTDLDRAAGSLRDRS